MPLLVPMAIPIYARLIAIVILLIVIVTVTALLTRNRHYICPECHENFRLTGVKAVLSPRGFGGRAVTCPNCGKHSFLKSLPGKQ